MATDPKAKLVRLSYEKGSITLTRGLAEYLFGEVDLQWQTSEGGGTDAAGRRKKKYGTNQKSLARAGKPMSIRIDDGSVWTVRVSGADIDFLDKALAKAGTKIEEAWTPRGTIYSRQFPESF